jgi:hypothetical protein
MRQRRASEKGASGPHLVDSGAWARGRACGKGWHRWARVIHGGGASSAWQPHRRFIEQMAGAGVGQLERMFGLHPGRIELWAQYEVCCVDDALQLLLRYHKH